jgi:hypothetical protein
MMLGLTPVLYDAGGPVIIDMAARGYPAQGLSCAASLCASHPAAGVARASRGSDTSKGSCSRGGSEVPGVDRADHTGAEAAAATALGGLDNCHGSYTCALASWLRSVRNSSNLERVLERAL